jgi:hypothetical protein
MYPEMLSPIAEDLRSNASTVLEQQVPAPAAPHKLLSSIRFTAFTLLIMFFVPWGSVWLTSCGSSSNGSPSGEHILELGSEWDRKLGSASGWDMARGKKFVVPTIQGSTEPIAIETQSVAMVIPVIAILLAWISIASIAGQVPRNAVYVAAVFGSLVIGIVALHIPNHVTVSADQQPILNQIVKEYASDDNDPVNGHRSDLDYASHEYEPSASLEFRWHGVSLLLIIGLLTTMGISGIAGLGERPSPSYYD